MPTPYDGAIRLERRRLDEVGLAVRTGEEQLDAISSALGEIDSQLRQEFAAAALDGWFSCHAFASRLHTVRERHRQNYRVLRGTIDRLRDEMTGICGRVQGMEDLAKQVRADRAAEEGRRDQSVADDLAAGALRRRSVEAAARVR